MRLPWFLAASLALACAPAFAGPYEDGVRLLERKSWHDAAAAFRRGARDGNAAAERQLGLMIYQGLGLRRDDRAAVAWLEKAAAHGDLVAQVDLASMYENGLGVAQDDAASARWYREAAGQGHMRSQFRLGEILWRGTGVAKDRGEALMWWSLALDQGGRDVEWMRGTVDSVRDPITAADWAEARVRAREWSASRRGGEPGPSIIRR